MLDVVDQHLNVVFIFLVSDGSPCVNTESLISAMFILNVDLFTMFDFLLIFNSKMATAADALLINPGLFTLGVVLILNYFFCNNVEMTSILQYLTVKY